VFGFRQAWFCDTEYGAKPDGRFGPDIRCLVAKEGRGHVAPVRLWYTELEGMAEPPFDIGPDSLFIAYNVTAELQCFLELGWPMPHNVIDLWHEYRAITNGKRGRKERTRLIDAMTYYQIDHIGAVEKEDMRHLAMRGPPYTDAEREALLDYCESDVDALMELLK
jgi:DNA polymerase-1